NAMSDSLLLPIAVLAMGVLRSRWVTLKLLGLGGLGFMVATIALSGSREALVGLFVVIAYLGWRTRYRIQIGSLAAVTLAASLLLPTSLLARLNDAISTGGAGRVAIWRVGLDAFVHNWLVGYGLGSFPTVYDHFYLRVYQAYSNGWGSAPHNLLVQSGVELGLVGIVLVGWFIVTTFTALRDIGSDSEIRDYRIMMEAALLGLFVVSMFIGLFTYKYAWLVFTLAAQVRLLGIQEARERRVAALSEADS
ncbi:MAG TPA: O-antigen ligase family protein, partial [Candidatus Dormibacteraeota bacterium]|nr:O-antigen ligase family protein [Candidatus Dormibacteraeota bacterium]